ATSFEAIQQGPWHLLSTSPGWETTRFLSRKWSLRGADLWHLAAAKTLQDDLPELVLLTFDSRLEKAAEAEGLAG
ncbi:MAG: PIN domain-containing protein, partial [Deltaproteobacteria bacterium]|nr:PIN domain-containing protein [Deltaproteobacteria bacterium]